MDVVTVWAKSHETKVCMFHRKPFLLNHLRFQLQETDPIVLSLLVQLRFLLFLKTMNRTQEQLSCSVLRQKNQKAIFL